MRTLIALAAAALILLAPLALAQSPNPQPNPKAGAQVAELKARTAALIAAAPPLGTIDQPPVIWRVPGAISQLWDGPGYPKMTIVPAGEFTMGSPDAEPGRAANEGPQHRVRIARPFAVGAYPVTFAEFAKFADETGYTVLNQCQRFQPDGKWDFQDGCTWRDIGFPQATDSPVVAVNWTDAHAYIAWLNRKTGHTYRLLSEAEYEYAERAGSTTAFWWGDDPLQACAHANGADLDAKAVFPRWTVNECHDGDVFAAPMSHFKPNPFGLYAMSGNTWSWIEDCWTDSYAGAPIDGSARTVAQCLQPMIRGGSWAEVVASLRSSQRGWNIYNLHFPVNGFRVARDL
jgi:formylglycine-generating enzyme required for sulfatase activity